jgi:hypothetical protein
MDDCGIKYAVHIKLKSKTYKNHEFIWQKCHGTYQFIRKMVRTMAFLTHLNNQTSVKIISFLSLILVYFVHNPLNTSPFYQLMLFLLPLNMRETTHVK